MKKFKRRWLVAGVLFLFIVIGFLTNPTLEDYEAAIGYPPIELEVEPEIEHINFFVFSTYTPVFLYEHGITHLGIFGKFYQISDGQFDYPVWLEPFN